VARDGAVKSTDLRDAIFNKDALYIATKSVLYRAKDLKEKWEPVFSLPSSGNNEITCVAGRLKNMFIGTRRGLFRSDDYGATWKNVFRTILPDKNNITYIELSRHSRSTVVIATGKGVFISDDLGASWQDISGSLGNTAVICLALNKEYMYAGAESGLYMRKMAADDWERVFIRNAREKKETEESQEYSEEDEEQDMSIRTIAVDGIRVYVGYSKEIIFSDDQCKSWQHLPCAGLGGAVNDILVSGRNKKLFCATDRGVFEFDAEKKRWLELYKGISKSVSVSSLLFGGDDESVIFAVTDKGLYSLQGGDYMADKYPDIEKSLKTLKTVFDGEPTYKELQQAAIRFCDVNPEKIKNWQRDSKIRSIIPKISLDYDNHVSTNYEIYTSATKDYVTAGPDDIYSAVGASVSWDLANLIWSDDQTNIDVRSRLMVQLRNDILDDLRRAYYERKKVQFELMTNPPKDLNARFDKEMRLQELTQAIDDLTGNYLSEYILKTSKKSS
jgi:photosystem II stability/assembly factor-like uncharacterized protein